MALKALIRRGTEIVNSKSSDANSPLSRLVAVAIFCGIGYYVGDTSTWFGKFVWGFLVFVPGGMDAVVFRLLGVICLSFVGAFSTGGVEQWESDILWWLLGISAASGCTVISQREKLVHDQAKAVHGRVSKWNGRRKALRNGTATDREWTSLIANGENLISSIEGIMKKAKPAKKFEKYDLAEALAVMKSEVAKLDHAWMISVGASTTPRPPSVGDLSVLRQQGLISEDEFIAFSRRFRKSSGEEAEEIIRAINSLFEQHKKGAMSEGNYHAGLWALLDKLDRELGKT